MKGPPPQIPFPAVSFRFSRRSNPTNCLRTGLLLLLLPQSEQTNTGDLDDLETDTGNITLGLTLTTETSEENLVVLVDEVQATIVGNCIVFETFESAYVSPILIDCVPPRLDFFHNDPPPPNNEQGDKTKGLPTESGDLLAVLDQLDLNTLPNGGVGLLGLNTDLFEDDTLGVRSTSEGRRLEGGSEKTLLVVQVGPLVVTTGGRELAGSVQTSRLSLTHLGGLCAEDGQLLR